MAPQIPSTEPASLTAGTSWKWTRTVADFPVSEGWAATYFLTGKSSLSFTTTPVSATNTYDVDVAPNTTSAVDAGTYVWVLRLCLDFSSASSPRYDVDRGVFEVLADPNVAADSDQRTHAEKMVALLKAELQARIDGTGSAHDDYQIGTRSIKKMSVAELQRLLNLYEARVAIEQYGKLPDVEATFVRP